MLGLVCVKRFSFKVYFSELCMGYFGADDVTKSRLTCDENCYGAEASTSLRVEMDGVSEK